MNEILKQGKCVGSGQNDLFFSDRPEDLAAAQVLCGGCQVAIQCLDLALETGSEWGVWGGVIFWDGELLHRKRARGRPRRVDQHLPLKADKEKLRELMRTA
jgi:WhiB family redox-sensing transcriptional regulator